jgi:hypothetical protein
VSEHAWNYDTITFAKKDWKLPHPSTETVWEALNRLGPQGWEMVQCLPDTNPDSSVMVLKKRIKVRSHR